MLEVLAVVVIVGILAALSIPLYAGYVRKGKITETFLAISDIKRGVMTYYQKRGVLADCDATDADDISDTFGIAVDDTNWTYAVVDGAITATATAAAGSGLTGGAITATPTESARGSISWAVTADGTTIKQDEVS